MRIEFVMFVQCSQGFPSIFSFFSAFWFRISGVSHPRHKALALKLIEVLNFLNHAKLDYPNGCCEDILDHFPHASICLHRPPLDSIFLGGSFGFWRTFWIGVGSMIFNVPTSEVLGRQRFGPPGNPVLGDAQGIKSGEKWKIQIFAYFCWRFLWGFPFISTSRGEQYKTCKGQRPMPFPEMAVPLLFGESRLPYFRRFLDMMTWFISFAILFFYLCHRSAEAQNFRTFWDFRTR